LPAERVPPRDHVQPTEGALVRGAADDPVGEHDQPGAGAEHGQPGGDPGPERLEQLEGDQELADRGRLAARDDQPVQPGQVPFPAHRPGPGAGPAEQPVVLDDVALQRQDADQRHRVYQPRSASRCGAGTSSTLIPTIASPRPRDTLAITSGSSKNVVALTIAAARCAGLPDLKMPEPTNTPSAPSCIIIAASAGVAMPPAVNSTTGSRPASATSRTRSYGAWSSFAATKSSSCGSADRDRTSCRMRRMCMVALETSPVPASPL